MGGVGRSLRNERCHRQRSKRSVNAHSPPGGGCHNGIPWRDRERITPAERNAVALDQQRPRRQRRVGQTRLAAGRDGEQGVELDAGIVRKILRNGRSLPRSRRIRAPAAVLGKASAGFSQQGHRTERPASARWCRVTHRPVPSQLIKRRSSPCQTNGQGPGCSRAPPLSSRRVVRGRLAKRWTPRPGRQKQPPRRQPESARLRTIASQDHSEGRSEQKSRTQPNVTKPSQPTNRSWFRCRAQGTGEKPLR